MNNNYEICPNCLKELNIENGKCKECQFDIEKFKENESCLKPFTMLQNKYRIGRPIGIGGFGITYIGWDVNLETYIAIKEFYPESFAKRSSEENGNKVVPHESKVQVYEKGLKRFVEEAQNLSKFYKLKGIVSVKDFFYEYGTAYIVMEYINGVNLKEYLRLSGGKISEKIIKKIMHPVLESMITVHKSGLMHRDISPDNIMVDDQGEITLIDFGSVRSQSPEGEMTYTVVLKHGYAPPEQYYSKSNQGPWTDVYSLCATMYKMLTGDNVPNAVERMEADEYQSPREKGIDTSDEMENALRKGLAVKVDDRYKSVEELMLDLYQESGSSNKRNAFAQNEASKEVQPTDNTAANSVASASSVSQNGIVNHSGFSGNNTNGVDSEVTVQTGDTSSQVNAIGNPFNNAYNGSAMSASGIDGNASLVDGMPIQVEAAWPMQTQAEFDIKDYVNVNNNPNNNISGPNVNTAVLNDEKELESFGKRKKIIIISSASVVALALLVFGGIKLFGKKPETSSNKETTQNVVSSTETEDTTEAIVNSDPDDITTESDIFVSDYDPYEHKKNENWDFFDVKVNGTQFMLGEKGSNAIPSGWEVNEDELDEIINEDDNDYMSVRSGEAASIILQFTNESSQAEKIKDCILTGIDLNYYDDDFNSYEATVNNITLGKSTYEDILNEFGEGGLTEFDGKKIVNYVFNCQGRNASMQFTVSEENKVIAISIVAY